MQSSALSFSNSTLNFQPKSKPILGHSPINKPPQLPSISSSISSNQLTLRSQSQSQTQLYNNPTWNPLTTSSIKHRNTNSFDKIVAPLHCGIPSNGFDTNSSRSFRDWIELIGEAISTAFPIWVSLGCLLGLIKPSSFNWVTPKWTIIGLPLTMLGMGMTLTLDDLRGAFAMPKEIISGFVLQYSVMTPFLTAKLAGQYVAVDAAGLLMSTLQVVLLPVLAGAFLNQYFQNVVKFVSPLMPPIAVGTVAILCGNAIAQSASSILTSGLQVVLAAFLLHASGFFFGYALARMLGIDIASSRTISIEVGMQNSVLGVVLATQHFGNPLTAVPCAVSSVCHSIFGSILAGIWRCSVPKEIQN
ncbi:hypothetical protein LWI29_009818 [Acer saccharum]|uniref:Uncharacterized protein n=1 Tax=Acer saccharum TaxID=4024 RepID=A0AA39SYS8_ACESA|nr:hypothetical protein LWI29_009818 [Acer saccharum]